MLILIGIVTDIVFLGTTWLRVKLGGKWWWSTPVIPALEEDNSVSKN